VRIKDAHSQNHTESIKRHGDHQNQNNQSQFLLDRQGLVEIALVSARSTDIVQPNSPMVYLEVREEAN
jgi:hypothetical protein